MLKILVRFLLVKIIAPLIIISITMAIIKTEIYKFSIPMRPFTIATGTMHYAQNIFIRVHTENGMFGVGECSAFPMIVGETQATCFEMAKDFAGLWKGKDPLEIEKRMAELHDYTAFNSTIKSAFDMALYDLASKAESQPLYRYLGGTKKELETDLTIGIDTPEKMAETAADFTRKGVQIIKVKLGKDGNQDVQRIQRIAEAVGPDVRLRIDANQGWSFDEAVYALQAMGSFNIEFCEQPMRRWHDDRLPVLRKMSPVKIMADESVFDHYDAKRLITMEACDYVNIKFAKSGGILEATKINDICEQYHVPCMMGGMLESRVALTAFAHFAMAHENIIFYDMDTCLLGHTVDPVKGGVTYQGFKLQLTETIGIGADVDQSFLDKCEKVII